MAITFSQFFVVIFCRVLRRLSEKKCKDGTSPVHWTDFTTELWTSDKYFKALIEMAVPFDYSQVEDPEYGFMLPPDSSDDEDIPSESERSVSSQALSLPTKSESQVCYT